MSFWGKLAGIGMMGAGFVTGNPALIGAGATVMTGDMAADASKNAAKTQSQAADKAMALNTRMYDDTSQRQAAVYADNRAAFVPFVNLGTSAAGSLGSLLNLPPGSAMSATPPAGAMPAGGAGQYLTDAMGRPTPILQGGGRLLPDPQSVASQATQSGYAGSLGTLDGEDLVAPDGTHKRVPREQVAYYVSRGARRASEVA